MKNLSKACFICGHLICLDAAQEYQRCLYCGHQIQACQRQTFIINDALAEKNVLGPGWVDRFKRDILLKYCPEKKFLLDVGSGSGAFLHAAKPIFQDCAGIEVTPECIEYARQHFGLRIETDIYHISENISAATFWHSFEHIPASQIGRILAHIYEHSSGDIRLIVCVPNNASLQYKLFGRDFAYYDPLNHIHQFSIKSLDCLIDKFGFKKAGVLRVWPYSIFGYLQGFLNKFNAIHNYCYGRQKRGQTFGRSCKGLLISDVYNFLLGIIFCLPSILLSIFDLIFPERGGVITVCYKKNIS